MLTDLYRLILHTTTPYVNGSQPAGTIRKRSKEQGRDGKRDAKKGLNDLGMFFYYYY